MKKLLFVLGITAVIISCKKENTTVNGCKFSRVIHIAGGDVDTAVYSYAGDDVSYTATYSYIPNLTVVKYTKSGSQYLYKSYSNGTQMYDGFIALNAQGLYDTLRFTNLSASTSSSAKYYYDANNNLIRNIGYYNGYINDIKYFYSNGNYSYWIYDYFDLTTPANSTKDSVVYEYYTDKLKVADRYLLEEKTGNLEKNLVKKRLYYNLFNSGTLRRTDEYEYLTDSKGLVTREIWTNKSQPGDVVVRRDTTYFEYNCN